MPTSFTDAFQAITGNPPFPWQSALYQEFLAGPPFRDACDLPTGVGKTSVIAIWLLALAERARTGSLAGFPRRLVYVVNRRTVVDQATCEAEKLRQALQEHPALTEVRKTLLSVAARQTDRDDGVQPPLAISTLRGEHADNAEWRDDPARAALIIGTVDMIGSRLLFAGYGPGFRSRPLHAGFLGQDVLLVHDEAHLEPAFQELLREIAHEQQRCQDFRRLSVMALSATARSEASSAVSLLTNADLANPEVCRRLNARKTLRFHTASDKDVAARIAQCALAHKDSNQAILVYAHNLKDVWDVAEKLRKAGCKVQRLTGTMRGRERERLLKEDPVFLRFLHPHEPHPLETVYLICTSAGEVGIDMSADHLVCDLTPFDSMAQRFGRVNRFGQGNATIDIVSVHSSDAEEKKEENATATRYQERCKRTLALLQSLSGHSASPAALAALPAAERLAAFTPEPTILPATDILFDAWALTTVRNLPGRPPVDEWLHGVAEWEPPETRVAWREDVALVKGDLVENYPPDEMLEDYPLKPHELLHDRYDRVFEQVRLIADRNQNLPVWIVGERDALKVTDLRMLVSEGKEALRYKTVILPPDAGGLGFTGNSPTGFLDGKADYNPDARDQYDVGDQWLDADGNPRRCRLWDEAEPDDKSMRLVRVIDMRPDDDEAEGDEEPPRRYWCWYVRPRSADDEGSRTATDPQTLQPHLRCAADFADCIVTKLGLPETEAVAIKLAARWHDLGKNRRIWQRAVGNRRYPQIVLAKSGGKMHPIELSKYRHELGSLIDVENEPDFRKLDQASRDLVLHLIAAHHGRARPHFPADEVIDQERPLSSVEATAREVPQRFAHLQRKYGRWGLAWLESLLRAADIMASQEKLAETAAVPGSAAAVSVHR